MRTILIYLLSGMLILSQIGCSDDNNVGPGEPIVWYQYFAFVDEEGNDFFENNADYSIPFLLFDFGEFKFDDSVKINDLNIFGYGGWGSSVQYITFGNGDIDTLTRSWEPILEKNISMSFVDKDIEKYTFFYNGKEIATWDFLQNPELFDELIERNKNTIANPTATNPIYIEIVKKPNPEEFD